jgi:hypothetical protein
VVGATSLRLVLRMEIIPVWEWLHRESPLSVQTGKGKAGPPRRPGAVNHASGGSWNRSYRRKLVTARIGKAAYRGGA